MRIGFMGLGHMGSKMATRLLQAGFEAQVYNRTASAADSLVKQGARFSPTPAGLVECDVLITMLADDKAVESVVYGTGGIFESLKANRIHLSMSTISPALAERLDKDHQVKSCTFIGAPVFGRPDAAEAGKLFIMAGGNPKTLGKCQPIFEALSQKVFHVSPRPEHAHLTKVLGNFMLISSIQILGEALAMAQKSGLDPKSFLEGITGSLFSAPLFKNYGGMIVDQLYDKKVGFKIPLALKDIRLAQAAAEMVDCPMPTVSLVHDQLLTALSRGLKDMDMSALGKLAADNAGV